MMSPPRYKRHGGFWGRSISTNTFDFTTAPPSKLENGQRGPDGFPRAPADKRTHLVPPQSDNHVSPQPLMARWSTQEQPTQLFHSPEAPFEIGAVPPLDQDPEWPLLNSPVIVLPDSSKPGRPLPRSDGFASLSELSRIHDKENIDTPEPEDIDLDLELDKQQISLPRRDKIITPAQFENYLEIRVRESHVREAWNEAEQQIHEDDDQEEIDYDTADDEDMSKQLADQRRHQAEHIANYRQRMIKTTGDTSLSPVEQCKPPTPKTPSPAPSTDARGTPPTPLHEDKASVKSGQSTRSNRMRSNSSPRPATRQSSRRRAGSTPSQASRQGSHSPLPEFARGLPQDPFPNRRDSVTRTNKSGYPCSVVPISPRTKLMRPRPLRRANPNAGNQQSYIPHMKGQQSSLNWAGGALAYRLGQMSSPCRMPGTQHTPLRPPPSQSTSGAGSEAQY
ncbi:uncharacterized protein NECHADRAFT_82741 [Fusarium vanettenii 77-13-4]|uniref:Uncharacterized protein n=1 Tax=Fusarium vanettenii (strain ATCC MYA-4622 / CBS 123669 / FGSC 9596 / NRRL 45880 / 77-13-4) TaxID=660122 RepID=C7YY35_FUSV7|nr:uncharacterized protein NECHADRAFT_82741 [Fusarium vanettenii 77-13-4]EEU43700.1 predicted protein [Fusarium vanettenii 77-13-4]